MARITSADVGRRVSVRRRTPSGSATDVVGDLVDWTDTTIVVRDRDDVHHRLARGDIIASRLVVAKPPPARTVHLERVAAAGWPAVQVAQLGEWWLRAAGGFTGRANSALAIGDPGMPFHDAADTVRDWYAARALPARAAVIHPSPEDDGFAGLGWQPSPVVLVQAAEVAAVLRGDGSDKQVEVSDAPGPPWLARYTARGTVDETARQVLTGGGTVGFAAIGDPPAAVGRGVVVDEWLGISAVEVAAGARRQGLASAITEALVRWGSGHGAARVYLQVPADNAAARALYAAAGFHIHHRYRYRYRFAPPTTG